MSETGNPEPSGACLHCGAMTYFGLHHNCATAAFKVYSVIEFCKFRIGEKVARGDGGQYTVLDIFPNTGMVKIANNPTHLIHWSLLHSLEVNRPVPREHVEKQAGEKL